MKKIYYLLIAVILVTIIYFAFIKKNKTTEYFKINDEQIKEHNFNGYKVKEIYNLLTPKECEEIMKFAKKKGMVNSEVLNDNPDKITELNTNYRNSKTAWISPNEFKLAEKLSNISYQLTNIPKENQEMLQVVEYKPGGKFNPHYDSCVMSEEICKKMNRNGGQRRSTLLIYLNDDYENGETEFVKLGLKVKPEKGKGLLFYSVDEDEKLYPESEHQGIEVKNGNKWICTIWSHKYKYE